VVSGGLIFQFSKSRTFFLMVSPEKSSFFQNVTMTWESVNPHVLTSSHLRSSLLPPS